MPITLNHTIVPARDKQAAAKLFAEIFSLEVGAADTYFAPVRVNDALTFLFSDEGPFESHHYAFHVSESEFDTIFDHVKKAGLTYGSAPWSADDRKLATPDGHLLELMTVPQ